MTDPEVLQVLVELYESPGWEVLEATARKRREDAIQRLILAEPADCPAIQAEIRTLDWLLSLPEDTRSQYRKATKRPEGAGKED